MPPYEILFSRSARKELQSLPLDIAERILEKIELLAVNPRPPDCKKLKGYPNYWRIRISEYRVLYSIFEDRRIVDISVIRHRSEAYR
jgi:mRNA interferase RelE/StbE